MRIMMVGATVLVVGAGASTVWAANPPDTTGNNIALQGSDTLEEVTKAVLAACPNAIANGITYAGGGSGTGETAMSTNPPTQKEAPMSRFINASVATCAHGPTNEGLVIGLDGLAVVGSTANAGTSCGGALAAIGSFTVTDITGTPVVGCPGCDAGTSTYTISNAAGTSGTAWKDVLKLVFAGIGHDGTRDCAGNVRRSLIQNYGKLFQTGCTSGTCSAGLRHAFRRGDASGTTDVFLASMGAPLAGLASAQIAFGKPAINWFCNAWPLKTVNPPPFPDSACTGAGTPRADCSAAGLSDGTGASNTGKSFGGAADYLDGDPLRTPCETNLDPNTGNLLNGDEVCSPGTGLTGPLLGTPGSLGVVLATEVPANLDLTTLYTTTQCTSGKFALVRPNPVGDVTPLPNTLTPCPDGLTSCPCPNGGNLVLGKCFQPYQDLGGGIKNFNCIAQISPIQGLVKHHMTDGRGYNLFVKNSAGQYLKDGFSIPESPTLFADGTDPTLSNRFITNASFRMHTTVVSSGGGSTCQLGDSTAQIGCLAQADPCSLGYAGREADTATAGVVALNVNGVADTEVNIVKILSPVADPTVYPLSRKLFFNTLYGFENLIGGELELAKCMGNHNIVDNIVLGHGFIPMSHTTAFNAGGLSFCQDFNEQTACTAAVGGMTFASNTNACATLPAGLIQ